MHPRFHPETGKNLPQAQPAIGAPSPMEPSAGRGALRATILWVSFAVMVGTIVGMAAMLWEARCRGSHADTSAPRTTEQETAAAARGPEGERRTPTREQKAEALRLREEEEEALKAQVKAAARLGIPMQLSLDLGDGVSMKLVLIPAGEFEMGSREGEEKGLRNEKQHTVRITEPFYIGGTEVTQEQYEAVMGYNLSRFKGARNPVEMVSWNAASAFCRNLSQKTGKTVRLPTEAEWEYACRAGTTTPFHFGETMRTDQANYDGNYTYGNGRRGTYRERTMPVASFPANAWGLYDMHGNVYEYCQDRYADYLEGMVTDPRGPASGDSRVVRSGSWGCQPRDIRSAMRLWCDAVEQDAHNGLRVVVEVPGGTE